MPRSCPSINFASRLRRWLLVTLWLSTALGAKPSTFKAGLKHYFRGDFVQAISQLQKAVADPAERANKGRAFKFIGISQFALGKTQEAEQSFRRCLEVDRECDIKKDEALDESVLPFFRKLKTKGDGAKVAAARGSTAPVQSARTLIEVQSNVKTATILIDGILAGNAGASLSSAPGNVEVEVQAKGYRPRRLKLAVAKNALNKFKIDLVPEGPSREELAAAALARDKAQAKERENRDRARAEDLAAEKALHNELRADDRKKPMSSRQRGDGDERDFNAEMRESRESPVLPRDPLDEKIGNDMFGEEERSERRSSRSRMSEEHAPSRDLDEITALPDPRTANKGKIPISLFHLLPLGGGQFYNDDYLLGIGILGVQAYGVYSFMEADQRIQQANTSLTAASTRTDITAEQYDAYIAAINGFIAKARTDQQNAYYVLAGSYVFGVLHAILMRPDAQPRQGLAVVEEGFHLSLETPQLQNVKLVMDWRF